MKRIFPVLAIVCSHVSVQAQVSPVTTTDTVAIRSQAPEPAPMQAASTYSLATTTQAPPEGRRQVYKIKPWLDIPLTLATDGWALYGMSVIYGRDEIPQSEIDGLDRNNVNKFDRSIIDNYSESAKSTSDLFFYGSMPLPLLLLLDKEIRRDGPKVGLMYLQAMGITGTIYTTSAMLANRYRPYAYNKNAPPEDRRRGGARNSFFAGHVAVVGTSTFFMAKVYNDYHPNMKGKWILYALAGGATATTGFLRMAAGQHFRTDVITGAAVGTAVGILVPHLHKNKLLGNGKLAIYPNIQPGGSNGMTAILRL